MRDFISIAIVSIFTVSCSYTEVNKPPDLSCAQNQTAKYDETQAKWACVDRSSDSAGGGGGAGGGGY